MSKRAKYKIGFEEAEIATLLRLNPDQWFTDGEIHSLLGHAPNTHLGRLVQLRVADILRIAPEPTYRWSTKADRNNAQYVTRLNEVVKREGITAFDYGKLVNDGILDVRSIETPEPVVESEPELPNGGWPKGQRIPVDPDTGKRLPYVPPTEVIITPDPVIEPSELEETSEWRELTPEERRLRREYEKRVAMVTKRSKTGRFMQNNLVWHPEYGSGTVLKQYGSKQMIVKFPRPHGQMVVNDADLIEDTDAIARVEELICHECGKRYPRTTHTGRRSLYCSTVCRNRRNARVKAEKTARAAERAVVTAEKAVEALHPPKGQPQPSEEVAALITSRPVVVDAAPDVRVGLLIRKGGHVSGQDQLTVEAAIELLMDLLP